MYMHTLSIWWYVLLPSIILMWHLLCIMEWHSYVSGVRVYIGIDSLFTRTVCMFWFIFDLCACVFFLFKLIIIINNGINKLELIHVENMLEPFEQTIRKKWFMYRVGPHALFHFNIFKKFKKILIHTRRY